jgi:hypothetical protein
MRGRRRGAGWKRALVFAIDEHARSFGYETVLAPNLPAGHADLLVRTPQTVHLIRVELENIDEDEAARQHDIIRRYKEPHRFSKVLWLTYDCHWVDTRIPAFGVRLVSDSTRPERALDIGGLSAIVDAGILRPDRSQMLRQPDVSGFGLALVLEQYLAGQLHHDTAGSAGGKAYFGWASPGKWNQMMRAIMVRNRALRGEIRERTDERDDALRSAARASEELAMVNEDLARVSRRLEEMESALEVRTQRLAVLERQLVHAKDCLRSVEAPRATRFGRVFLRRVPGFSEDPPG